MQSAKMAVFIHKYEYMGITKNIHPWVNDPEMNQKWFPQPPLINLSQFPDLLKHSLEPLVEV